MTTPDLVSLIDKIWSIETDDMQEELTPTIVAETSSGSMFVFKMPFSNDVEKEAAFAFVQKQLIENSCVRYVFVHEVWAVLKEPDDQPWCRPSEDPTRQEKIIAVGVERSTGEALCYMANISTSEGVRSVGERESLTHFAGRLASLFGDDGSFSQTRH